MLQYACYLLFREPTGESEKRTLNNKANDIIHKRQRY
jgi:hypothetical protein